MATRAQLVREILKELGVYQAGQDLPPEDYRVVDERLPFEVASLRGQDIYALDDVESVPDEALMELARYLAGEMTSMFGIAGEELQQIQAKQGAADQALRYLRARSHTGSRMRAEYF